MLPYDAQALGAFHVQVNEALWPAQVAALIIALIVLARAVGPLGPRAVEREAVAADRAERERGRGRDVLAVLAIAWACVGGGYFLTYLSALDFLAPLYGLLFLVQAGLLLWAAVSRPPVFRFGAGPFGWSGLALAAVALVLLPLAGAATGRDWAGVPVVGLMPNPTALFTLGLLLLAGGRGRVWLAPIPLLWSLIAGFQGWVLGLPQHLALAALGTMAAALLLWKHRAARAAAGPEGPP